MQQQRSLPKNFDSILKQHWHIGSHLLGAEALAKVQGRRRAGFRETRQAKPNSPSRYRQQQTFGFRAHDGTRGSTREQREPQQELPLAAVSDCQHHAVRSFPEHRRRDPKSPASAHIAPVYNMHYDAECPQWNGSIAVASRCTSKTTRLRTFTSSRQVTNVYLWLSNRSKYWRARPIHAM